MIIDLKIKNADNRLYLYFIDYIFIFAILISNYISPKPLVKKIAILSGSLIIMLLSIFTLGFHGNNKRVVESTGTIIAYGDSGGIVGNGSNSYAWMPGSHSNHLQGHHIKKTNIIAHIKVSQNKLLVQKT